MTFWDQLLHTVQDLPFDKEAASVAVQIYHELNLKRKQIGVADLFIAATPMVNNIPIATLNKKHFAIINNLKMADLKVS